MKNNQCKCGSPMLCIDGNSICLQCGATDEPYVSKEKPLTDTLINQHQKILTEAQTALLQNVDNSHDYCRNRGITDIQIRDWNLGYIPKGYPELSAQWEQRILFPITDRKGKNVIAFGGRKITVDDRAKYVNSRNGNFYQKSENLFGYSLVPRHCRRIYLCEGYVDALSLDAKLRKDNRSDEFAVASLGTALTAPQAMLIRAKAKEVSIAYDSDDAGVKAALRAIRILHNAGFDYHDIRVLRPVDAKDVDEAIQKGATLKDCALLAYLKFHEAWSIIADIYSDIGRKEDSDENYQ